VTHTEILCTFIVYLRKKLTLVQ